MRELQAVVFDLDDTLYPERAYVLSGFRAVAAWAEEQLDIPADQTFVELRQLFNEGVRRNTFDCWLENQGFHANRWAPQMVAVYREHQPQITPYPHVLEPLQRLRHRYRLGLVTDGYLAVQQRKLACLGVEPFFDAVVFSDELGPEAWKPSPRPFQVVLERLEITGPEAGYVADNPTKDFFAARHLGMWTVRVRHPDGLYRHLEPPSAEHAPDVEIESVDRLETILRHGLSDPFLQKPV